MALPCVHRTISFSSGRLFQLGLLKRVTTTCVRQSIISRNVSLSLPQHGRSSILVSRQHPFTRGFRTNRNIDPQPVEQNTSSLLKPLVFTVGVCSCSFLGAMVWNYESMRTAYQKSKKGIKRDTEHAYNDAQKAFGFRQHVNGIWANMKSGQKLILGIITANVFVWGLWRMPGLQKTAIRYLSASLSHPLPSMVLSSFSHINFLHLFVNMYVLWSFASVAVTLYGPEQFSAVYLSAGTLSAFSSIAMNKLLKRPSIISVGASGAIMGLLGVVCVTYPQAQLSIAFVSEIFPHSFSADTGMKAIILFDTVGLLLGWRFLDHAGHLGGIIFGILYAKYGHKLIWGNRETILKKWHDIRGKP